MELRVLVFSLMIKKFKPTPVRLFLLDWALIGEGRFEKNCVYSNTVSHRVCICASSFPLQQTLRQSIAMLVSGEGGGGCFGNRRQK